MVGDRGGEVCLGGRSWSELLQGGGRFFEAGVTLIELIISIVVIGIAATALLQSLGFLSIGNADPMLRSQSNLLAQNMLNEVLSQSFFEPDNDPRANPAVTAQVCPTAESDSGYDRRLWDNVCDYNGFDSNTSDNGNSGIRFKDGGAVSGLAGYRAQVVVQSDTTVSLGALSNSASPCSPDILRVDITVTDPRGQTLLLSGYRTSYWDEAGC